jgi:hypothetical protein
MSTSSTRATGTTSGVPSKRLTRKRHKIKVAEELMQDTGEDFDEVAQWVGPATRFYRYA